MRIIKHGILREAGKPMFFRCRMCGCIFMATKFEYARLDPLGAHGACRCPDCGYKNCNSMPEDDLADIIVNSYREDKCPPRHSQKNPLCAQADGCRECWANWLKQEAKA